LPDLVERDDRAAPDASEQLVWVGIHDHQFGTSDNFVRHNLGNVHAANLVDVVVKALDVLDVHSGQHADSRLKNLVDRLPSLLVSPTRHVGVREFVDNDPGWTSIDHCVGIELGELAAMVGDESRRNVLQPLGERLGVGPDVRAECADYDVLSACRT
jgi:hypothetical protein